MTPIKGFSKPPEHFSKFRTPKPFPCNSRFSVISKQDFAMLPPSKLNSDSSIIHNLYIDKRKSSMSLKEIYFISISKLGNQDRTPENSNTFVVDKYSGSAEDNLKIEIIKSDNY